MDWLERLLEIKRIKDQIKKLEKKKKKLQDIITEYQTCQKSIDLHLTAWDSSYQTYTGLELYPGIWSENQFEGQAAEDLGQMIPEAVAELQLLAGLMENISGEISNQILDIEEYIEKLDKEIAELQESLKAYE